MAAYKPIALGSAIVSNHPIIPDKKASPTNMYNGVAGKPKLTPSKGFIVVLPRHSKISLKKIMKSQFYLLILNGHHLGDVFNSLDSTLGYPSPMDTLCVQYRAVFKDVTPRILLRLLIDSASPSL